MTTPGAGWRLPVGPAPVIKMDLRKRRASKYSLQARGVLERVWAITGCQCGKYLAVSLPTLLDSMETHGELVDGRRDYSAGVWTATVTSGGDPLSLIRKVCWVCPGGLGVAEP